MSVTITQSNGTTSTSDVNMSPSTISTDIVIPPHDIKLFVLKTVEFILRMGLQYESEIKARQANNYKFKFLDTDSPYHSYYQWRIQHGIHVDDPITHRTVTHKIQHKLSTDEQTNDATKAQHTVVRATLHDKLQVCLFDWRVEIDECTVDNTAYKPTYTVIQSNVSDDQTITAESIEIIQLTARYIALNGREFLRRLVNNEKLNDEFSFLRSTHPLFYYFQRLIETYNQIVTHRNDNIQKLQELYKNNDVEILRQMLKRAKQHTNTTETDPSGQAIDPNQSNNQPVNSMAHIDWHSFVLVESIDFDSAEDDVLPQPRHTIDEINALFSEQQIDTESATTTQTNNNTISQQPNKHKLNETEPILYRDADIVSRYITDSQRQHNTAQVQKCAICGTLININELSEHMRIELLDDKWKAQKQAMVDKLSTSNITGDIDASIRRLAKQRTDMFVTNQQAAITTQTNNNNNTNKPIIISTPNQIQSQSQSQQPSVPIHSAPITTSVAPSVPIYNKAAPTILSHLPGMPSAFMQPATHYNTATPPFSQSHTPAVPTTNAPYGTTNNQQTPMRPYVSTTPQQSAPTPIDHTVTSPASKRARTDTCTPTDNAELIDETVFLNKLPHKDIRIHVQIPTPPTDKPNEFNFNGQIIDLLCNVTQSVAEIKKQLSSHLNNLALNKIKLTHGRIVYKDASTLAAYNVYDNTTLQLALKTRGGR